jgi:hypothetical protein
MARRLPPEIVQRVIRLSLSPTISYETLPERYADLRAYCLVCQAWRPWAQDELYRHLLVEDGSKAARVERALEWTGTRLSDGVRYLRLGSLSSDGVWNSGGSAQEMLRLCTRVEDLRIVRLRLSWAKWAEKCLKRSK